LPGGTEAKNIQARTFSRFYQGLNSKTVFRPGTEPLDHFSFQALGAVAQGGLDFLLDHARGNAEALGDFQVRRFFQARGDEDLAARAGSS
jgi:hypothetical protein